MAHKFQGKWRSFIVEDGQATLDGKFDLHVNNAGQIEMGSKHDDKDVTGKATTTATGEEQLEVIQDEPASTRKFNGKLAVEEDINGQKNMVIIGRFTVTPHPVVHPVGHPGPPAGDTPPPPPKEEGIWVVTKP